MTEQESPRFLAGVVEGFYGPPWTQAERSRLFDRLAALGLNTYLYAPKDDLKHRALWREPYADEEAVALRGSIDACRARGVSFVYGLSPGLDIRYGDDADVERLQRRFDQMIALGCEDFSLLFDDIPDTALTDADDSLAAAQCRVTNRLFEWLRARRPAARLAFCPTAYCSRMADAGVGGSGYLEAIGRGLLPAIDVLWTGPEIVSREITVTHLRGVQGALRRRPMLWDNLHANDYDGRRFFCGPYSGRPAALIGEVSGILLNPNCEFVLNEVPLRTFAAFVSGPEPYDARREYLAAMTVWRPSFATARGGVSLDELVLFGDCYYLPLEEGPEAEALLRRLRAAIEISDRAGAEDVGDVRQAISRLRDLTARLTELCDRPLFHALSRRIWDLREEADLLDRYLAHRSQRSGVDSPFRSDFHLPGTYRGGMAARLQRLLVQREDGTFAAAAAAGGEAQAARTGHPTC